VAYIADVAVLPRWIRVSQLLDYAGGVHPRFDRAKAEGFLARTAIKSNARVRELSKGMVTQLHLALVMAVDARLLVLDEPTLGLDILYRKQFYDSLLNDYFDQSRTILVTTHQVEEIQDVLTDVVFINRGRIVFQSSMEQLESRYLEVVVRPDRLAAARALRPIHERQLLGRSILLVDLVDGGLLVVSGGALWRAARAQRSLLVVEAGLGLHGRADGAGRAVDRSAGSHLRTGGRHAGDHAAGGERLSVDARPDCGPGVAVA